MALMLFHLNPAFHWNSCFVLLFGECLVCRIASFVRPGVPQWEQLTGADLITGGSRGGRQVPGLPPPPPGLNPALWEARGLGRQAITEAGQVKPLNF